MAAAGRDDPARCDDPNPTRSAEPSPMTARRLVVASFLIAGLALPAFRAVAWPAAAADRPLAHMVFFRLKDRSAEGRQKFVESCQKNLAGIAGITYFSVGTFAEDSDEPGVSVKDFDVALHSVFVSKAAKEAYLVDPRHKQFVEENKANFGNVRVFDSYVVTP
jgi:hypothetical protein